MIKYVEAVLIGLTLLCLLAVIVQAEEIPKGLGHPKGSPAPHWYEDDCCNKQDCEPLPFAAVTMVPEGYRLRYRGSLGFLVDLVVPWNKVKDSKDGQHHGCSNAVRFICFYAATGA
jgi:hypothetical protein